jgi:hypothetical protein
MIVVKFHFDIDSLKMSIHKIKANYIRWMVSAVSYLPFAGRRTKTREYNKVTTTLSYLCFAERQEKTQKQHKVHLFSCFRLSFRGVPNKITKTRKYDLFVLFSWLWV